MKLKEIAHARSGDKGKSVNIGVIGNDAKSYQYLESHLTPKVVAAFFNHPEEKVKRYFWPKLFAINFVIEEILDELKADSQGKAFATALLELEMHDGISTH